MFLIMGPPIFRRFPIFVDRRAYFVDRIGLWRHNRIFPLCTRCLNLAWRREQSVTEVEQFAFLREASYHCFQRFDRCKNGVQHGIFLRVPLARDVNCVEVLWSISLQMHFRCTFMDSSNFSASASDCRWDLDSFIKTSYAMLRSSK